MTSVYAGSMKTLPQRGKFIYDVLTTNFIHQNQLMFEQFGDFNWIEWGSDRLYNVANAEVAHDILVKKASSFYKDPGYRDQQGGIAMVLGRGLITSDGAHWREHRKLVAPAFHAQRIHAYAETMVDATQKLMQTWEDGAQRDVSHDMMVLTLRIVAKTLFSTEVEADINLINRVIEQFQRIAVEQLFPSWLPTPSRIITRQVTHKLNQRIYEMIAQRRANGGDNGDLMAMLLLSTDEDGNRLSDLDVRDEAVTLILAGHETTSNTLSWTFKLLAEHPEVEARLHAELDAVLGGRVPTLADLRQLTYTNMVLREAMRLYPAAWVIGRQALEDVEIQGEVIPKGAILNIYTYFIQRNEKYWDNPTRFDPERFSPENEGRINKWAYIPFSTGPRVCVGNSFAMMEAQLLLATIASRFQLSLPTGHSVELNPLVTLNPKGGLPMILKERQPILQPS
jgi:cytochrome P450